MLYLHHACCAAPWLLREGQHIRVDIVLRALPPRVGLACEWIADVLGLACCLVMVWYGARGGAGELQRRRAVDQDAGDARVVVPGAAADLLSRCSRSRCVFRMRRLAHAERGAARRRGERGMSDVVAGRAAWLMLGGSTVLLFLGLPVAFTFLVDQHRSAPGSGSAASRAWRSSRATASAR